MTIITKLLSHATPLCFMPDGKLICCQHGDLVVMLDGEVLKRYSLPKTAKEMMLGRSKKASRFFRFGIRTAIAIDDETVIFSRGNMLYEFDIQNGVRSKGYFCGDGVRPLMFTIVRGNKTIDEGVYFGGYLGNDAKEPVSIYHRKGVDNWETVYTFPQGTINHVHNIIADPFRNCLWIFTGDFGKASAIWKATDNFKKVEFVVGNNQRFRGCVAYALREGLLYATDTPFDSNYIYLYDTENNESKALFPIDGSCIYGCCWKDNYIFSTTVEGGFEPGWSRLRWAFTRKRGAGIKDDYVHMYMGNLKEGFKEIYKEKKDCMPFYTFQFGVFKFPTGVNNTDSLYFQPIATKSNDLRLMSLK